MHPMMILGVLLHVTLLAVVAFFVLFAAQKAQGLVKLLGNGVGVWLLALAALALLAAVSTPMFGGRPFGMSMGGHMSFPMMHDDRYGEAPPRPNGEPAEPDAGDLGPNK